MNQIELLKKTYKGAKVFLTGHTGFKGSWLTVLLNELGAEVKGYALAPEDEKDIYNSIDKALFDSVIGDLRDRQKLEDEIINFQPDFIFHLAAQPLVRLSYKIPAETFEVNVIGTANLLSAVQKLNKKCQVICITTDKVYHNNEWIYPYRETDRLGGYDPYSASKAACEIVISSYKNSFFNSNEYQKHQKCIASVRAGNVIGGGDWSKDRLLPDIVNALSMNKDIEVRNPNAVRPWQHVLEPLFGYLSLGSKMIEDPIKYATAYNFGPSNNDNLSVKEILEIAINSYGSGSYSIKEDKSQPHEAGLLRLDISKVSNDLNWQPRFTAHQAVDLTIQWYKNFNNGDSPIELIKRDIKKFIDS
ncbi:CDP-glucose 4,6-dehydratase [Flavobacterium sandaracinum]|uniref:CDP-glucose 4,6-dehydratase n=1 Tax=Flavobacterium sandaracinum TaxID=2541733 RepID=A0A4R5D3A7_9FLAO|nr:CDP-glucose 4,6-dehydratase [Flavobacterium sandaracinum]TDE04755.1 CDP-glucose 4,6-dehydratase [Flavobacterium sandaracinum]